VPWVGGKKKTDPERGEHATYDEHPDLGGEMETIATKLLSTRGQHRCKRETAQTNANQDEAWVSERARRRESHEEALGEGLRVRLGIWQRL
jgi:hypothetical protein